MMSTPGKWWISGVLILAVTLTSIVIAHSEWRGRLQYQVDYEDVITFLDGLKRYRALMDKPQGHLQFLYQYVTVECPRNMIQSL